MKCLLITVFTLFIAQQAWATAQKPEEMSYQEQLFDMYSTPLESYFASHQKRPKLFTERPNSSACWRGYVGKWQIKSDQLFLITLLHGYPSNQEIKLKDISPDWTSPVFASWYSGTLRLGRGKLVMGGMGFDSTREEEIFIEIEQGKVISKRLLHNKKE